MEGKYFDNAKVGDKVFDVDRGESGTITTFQKNYLTVTFLHFTQTYDLFGKIWGYGTATKQTLFYADEVEFVIKPRKKMVKREIVRYCAVHREVDNNGRNYQIYNLGSSAEFIRENSKDMDDFVGLGRAVIEFEEKE